MTTNPEGLPARFVDYERVASRYHQGRSPVGQTEAWRAVVAPHVPGGDLRVLDLGVGTGIFARAWPEWGASAVIGIDPSLAMLDEAVRAGLPAAVRLVAASGEALPLPSASIDAAWLSAVIHHLTDRGACASELRRVLRPEGTVLIRGLFRGLSRVGWLPFFPGAPRALARFPSVEEVAATFATAGFTLRAVEEVAAPPSPIADARSWVTQMRHADSLLTALSDAEFAEGLAAMQRSAEPTVSGSLHLAVFR